ncbi:hypothetical protein WJ542_04025 [Paraburkholderia sp. B3]|uniref:hypothetical protein n=1 Tax=Paraburkholderia sp. B3 TaxID=3134791 RepID=UPI0039823FA8
MNVAEFAIIQALNAANLPIINLKTDEPCESLDGKPLAFTMYHAAEDGSVQIVCRGAEFYSRIIGAVSSAMESLHSCGLAAPSVRFEMVAA